MGSGRACALRVLFVEEGARGARGREASVGGVEVLDEVDMMTMSLIKYGLC